jgi:hypothetical protein
MNPFRTRFPARAPARTALATALVVALGAACAAPAPKIVSRDPEAQRQARKDYAECVAQGEKVRRAQQGEAAGNVLEDVAVRGAEAGAAGAVFGDAGRGAAAGAAAGAAGGIVRGLFRQRRLQPEVDRVARRCLEERGYRVED